MCVCGWSGDSAGAKKKKKPKDSLRVNLFTIVVVFVICKYGCGGVALDSRQFLSHCTYYAMYF